jgi:hypothetical protein
LSVEKELFGHLKIRCFLVIAFRLFFVPFSSKGLSFQVDPVGAMHDSVQDGIGHRLFSYYFVPLFYGQLGGDDGSMFTMPVLDDFQHGCPAKLIKGLPTLRFSIN